MYTQDVQRLLLWILGDGINPKWAFVKNKPLVEKIVVVMVDGLNEETLKMFESTIKQPPISDACLAESALVDRPFTDSVSLEGSAADTKPLANFNVIDMKNSFFSSYFNADNPVPIQVSF
jgi:RNA exonuclease 1